MDGRVRCWGANDVGQLGLGNTDPVSVSQKPSASAPVDLGGRTVALAAGGAHTCALLESGAVRCWGWNVHGQLGLGNTQPIGDNEKPSAVAPVSLGATATAISAGPGHSCAVLAGGAVRCWGHNLHGELGLGHTRDVSSTLEPAAVEPIRLGGAAVQISSGGLVLGEGHSCAVMANGQVRCWGYNNAGQLGYGHKLWVGDDEHPESVEPVRLDSEAAVAIAAGGDHSCAALASGALRCWGSGATGALGNGNKTSIGDDEHPDAIPPVYLRNTPVVGVTTGDRHTCVLTVSERARCWGDGLGGQLGAGSEVMWGDDELVANVPDVNLGGGAVAITAGREHTCAVIVGANLRCWGSGIAGKLGYGNGDSIAEIVPAEVPVVEVGAPVRTQTQFDMVPGDPETRIDAPVSSSGSNVAFRYSSPSADVVDFECYVDTVAAAGEVSCIGTAVGGTVQLSGLAPGNHTFFVRAVDAVGNRDATAAAHTWRVQAGPATRARPGLRFGKVSWRGKKIAITARAAAGVNGRVRVVVGGSVDQRRVTVAKATTMSAGRASIVVRLRGKAAGLHRATVRVNYAGDARYQAASIRKAIAPIRRG